ncbi:Galactose oxidase [Gracilaria domingensis]|nr:Galactose oxidase [Gracilaria domingensis]
MERSPSCNHAAGPCRIPAVPLPLPPPPPPPPPGDPTCATGLAFNGGCCPKKCGRCGGTGCFVRGVYLGTTCCADKIKRDMRSCSVSKPPCKLYSRRTFQPELTSPREQPISAPVISHDSRSPEQPEATVRTIESLSLFLEPNLTLPATVSRMADPSCSRGIAARGACCPRVCGQCGGAACWPKTLATGALCCADGVKRTKPSCSVAGPPCKLAAPAPSFRPPYFNHATVSKGKLVKRHEACAVMVNGLVVLVGGRGVNKDVSIYNPKTSVWTNHPGPGNGIEIHHFQCVAAQGKVWIVSSWTGGFPFEKNNDKIFIYDVASNQWTTRAGLPPWRRRGGAAAVLRGDWIYVVAGNRGGHGGHATSLPWMDAYNYKTNQWRIGLPSMPLSEVRDHVGGGMVNNQLCIAGGRDGGDANFFAKNKAATYCFNFAAWKWEKKADMPVPRAGASTASICGGKLMVAGGEGANQAYKRVDIFNGWKWERGPDMLRARHGSGLAVAQCRCGQIFIPSGSGNRGGGPELFTTEKYNPPGTPNVCGFY